MFTDVSKECVPSISIAGEIAHAFTVKMEAKINNNNNNNNNVCRRFERMCCIHIHSRRDRSRFYREDGGNTLFFYYED
jgi:hypothetical protein